MNTSELRQSARVIWEAALNAANLDTCIRNFIQVNDGVLVVDGQTIPVKRRLIVVGAGKPSAKMAQVIEEILGDLITDGVVVTKYGHALPVQRIHLVEAGHPIPDAAGVHGAQETRELLRDLSEDDIVLCLISGGGSALWPAPAAGITLEEKQEVTQVLLRAAIAPPKPNSMAAGAVIANRASTVNSDVYSDICLAVVR